MVKKISKALFILIFLSLFVAIPLLHNHPASAPEKETCPAYLLQISLLGIVTAYLVLLPIFIPPLWAFIFDPPNLISLFFLDHSRLNRAPPLFISTTA